MNTHQLVFILIGSWLFSGGFIAALLTERASEFHRIYLADVAVVCLTLGIVLITYGIVFK